MSSTWTPAPQAETGAAAASDPAIQRIVADMSRVTFADPSLLNILLRMHRSARLMVAGPLRQRLVVLLELTGTHTALAVTDSPAATHARLLG
ncbi:hypothetical protein [Streptomyces sp. NPDC047014]|uniref:hypothetical protein n=1 Tax=Streptomyces sp. NPDC047014 TaxID=3155736 RepID=UPI0033E48882